MTKIAESGSDPDPLVRAEAWIRRSRSGSGSTPKCHGSATLLFSGKAVGLQDDRECAHS